MKTWVVILFVCLQVTGCGTPGPNEDIQTSANLPKPASKYCEKQGHSHEIRTAGDGSPSGVCIFPDGSECDEWAYYRGECGSVVDVGPLADATEIPTAMPIDPNGYQGWWSYINPEYGFSIMLPPDWQVEEIATSDLTTNGHLLSFYSEGLTIRMTFRQVGEEVLSWPTGVGAGEFIEQGTLEVAGQPARRVYFVCPNGEINAIWYHGVGDTPNIQRGDMEFGFIVSLTGHYCEEGFSVNGKAQHTAEMVIASLNLP